MKQCVFCGNEVEDYCQVCGEYKGIEESEEEDGTKKRN